MSDAPFLLDLRSTSGPPVGAIDDGVGGRINLHQSTTWLRIRSDVAGFVPPAISPEDDEVTGFVPPVFDNDGVAVLVYLGSHQGLAEQPAGLFHTRLDPDELDVVRAAVAAVDWMQLPQPRGGDRHAPTLRLRYASGPLLIERAFNANSDEFMAAIAPLLDLLDKQAKRMRKSPSATLEPSLQVLELAEQPFARTLRFGLRNRGVGPAALTDPRVQHPDGPPRLQILVGECKDARDWMAPHDWTTLELPALPEDEPRSRMLAPRRRWEVEVPWAAAKPGRYEVRARWFDYGGPLDPLPGQTPFMPIPPTGLAFVGSGPYPVRGSCWVSARFEVVDASAKL